MIDDLAAHVASIAVVRTAPVGTAFSLTEEAPTPGLDLPTHVEPDLANQLVTVGLGAKLSSLQAQLAEHGAWIPHQFPCDLGLEDPTLGCLINLNLPHANEGTNGSWRDWVVRLRFVLADGRLGSSGSGVVKSVAGYDVHKLLIGSRGALAIPFEATLRFLPLVGDRIEPRLPLIDGPGWIQRVEHARFEEACEGVGGHLVASDRCTGTLWCALDSADRRLPRYPGDWIVRFGCGRENLDLPEPRSQTYIERAKRLFDPSLKLNPGELGIL